MLLSPDKQVYDCHREVDVLVTVLFAILVVAQVVEELARVSIYHRGNLLTAVYPLLHDLFAKVLRCCDSQQD